MRIRGPLRFAAIAIVLAALVSATAAVGLAQPQPAAASGVVPLRGRVLVDDRSTPVRQARVTVLVGGRSWGPVFTDDQGRFEITVPDAGTSSIFIVKTGFVPAVSRGPFKSAEPLDLFVSRSAVLSGRVVDSAGRPVVSVEVRARRQGGTAKSPPDAVTRTNDLGEFRLPRLAAGEYVLRTDGRPEVSMTPAALSSIAPEQQRPDLPTSSPVAVAARSGQESDVTLVFQEGAVILPYAEVGGLVTGRMIDEFGEPVQGLNVQLWQVYFENGQRALKPAGPVSLTDDRGQYRLFHVPPGRYLVAATDDSWRAAGAQPSEFLPLYYPGRTAPADAFPIQVEPRQQLTGVDMVVTWLSGARIFGNAIDSLGRPLKSQVILRHSARNGIATPPPRTTAVRPDGTFEFLNVPSGSYVLRGSAQSEADAALQAAMDAVLKETLAKSGRLSDVPNLTIDPETRSRMRPSESAVLQITVDRSDAGPLTLRTAPTATVRGRIVFEGSPAMASTQTSEFSVRAFAANQDFATGIAASLQVAAAAIDGQRVATAAADTRGSTFEMTGVSGPIRIGLATAPPGWWLKSAFVGAINAAEEPVTFTSVDSRGDVEIVLADTAATITGSAVDESGRAVAESWVIVMAVDRGLWFAGSPYVKATLSNQTGRFTIASLPPGEYWIAAVDVVEGDTTSGEWQQPELLDSLAVSARKVALGERQRLEQRVVRTRR
ncbi:MAG TPA: carboxypeptidase regulatory-like domain-containing protein [Vicinamibacterales bacterium]|nr:carboxypeptidase regulatory-like domain-containing protein [Vicinamibacterales bacterium]